MNPEDYLDSLIERREYEKTGLLAPDEEIANRQAVVEALVGLQEIEIPQEFAQRLEIRLRARVRSLAQQESETLPVTQLRQPARSSHILMNRNWSIGFRLAAVLLIFCLSILTVTVYGIHGAFNTSQQRAYQPTLTFANQVSDRASIQINQLRDALAKLDTVVTMKQGDAAVQQALERVVAQTNKSQAAVTALPKGPEYDATQQDLQGLLLQEKQLLHQQLTKLDWKMRLAYSQQLATLGIPVPMIQQVIVSKQKNGTILLMVTGANFGHGTIIFVNGRRTATISGSAVTQFTLVINSSLWAVDVNAVEILNADASAAQVVLDNDAHTPPATSTVTVGTVGTATPIPTSTPSTYSFGTATPVPTSMPTANNPATATPVPPIPTDTPPVNNPATATPVPTSTPWSGGGDDGGNGYPPTPGPGSGDGPGDD